MRGLFLSLVVYSFCNSGVAVAVARKYTVDRDRSPVAFLAVGSPGFLRISGEGSKLGGTAEYDGTLLSGQFEVNLNDITTGIDLRDQHMKDKYLKTAQYPKAVLTLKPSAVSFEKSGSYDLPAEIEISGTKKQVTVKADLNPTANATSVSGEAELKIKISDFGIDIPSYLGVTVAEEVTISIEFLAKQDAVPQL